MRYTIKNRVLGNFDFFVPDGGGYVRLESEGKPGTLGAQICDHGCITGSTLSATPETMRDVCRRWYRQYMRNARSEQFL